MKILPPILQPAPTAIERRHAPARRVYTAYRPCLRWEFGFTCAFCLVHEADLALHGVEGTGLTGVEHHLMRSSAPERQDSYENCFYSCRFCNDSRHTAPVVDRHGRRLLEPCSAVWAHHFEVDEDVLRPSAGDADAEYTAAAYRVNDARRRAVRRHRAQALAEAYSHLLDGPQLRRRALAAMARARSADDRLLLANVLLRLARASRLAEEQIAAFAAVPHDAPAECRCEADTGRRLPPHIESQCHDA